MQYNTHRQIKWWMGACAGSAHALERDNRHATPSPRWTSCASWRASEPRGWCRAGARLSEGATTPTTTCSPPGTPLPPPSLPPGLRPHGYPSAPREPCEGEQPQRLPAHLRERPTPRTPPPPLTPPVPPGLCSPSGNTRGAPRLDTGEGGNNPNDYLLTSGSAPLPPPSPRDSGHPWVHPGCSQVRHCEGGTTPNDYLLTLKVVS